MFPDCDLQKAAERAVWTIGILSGQGCALPTRQLVHADIHDEFAEHLKAVATGFKVGDPLEPGVMVGPVISKAAADRILGMFERAKADGAGAFVMGGGHCSGALAEGNFIEPTIIAGVNPDLEIAQVEIFRPAVVVMKFHNDLQRVHRLAERLHVGGVYVNGDFQINTHTPSGGVGTSGFGKEGGKAVWRRLAPGNGRGAELYADC